MKKVTFFCVSILVSFSSIFAATVDIPSKYKNLESVISTLSNSENSGSKVNIYGGYEFVSLERDMEKNNSTIDSNFSYGVLGLSVFEKADLVLKVGKSTNPKYNHYVGGSCNYLYNEETAWAVSVKPLLWESKAENLFLYSDLTYSMTKDMPMKRWSLDSVDMGMKTVEGYDFVAYTDIEEYHVALGTGTKFEFEIDNEPVAVVPYAGVKYSNLMYDSRATYSGTNTRFENKGEDKIGMFAGVSLSLGKYISVSGEARFIDEASFSTKVDFRF